MDDLDIGVTRQVLERGHYYYAYTEGKDCTSQEKSYKKKPNSNYKNENYIISHKNSLDSITAELR